MGTRKSARSHRKQHVATASRTAVKSIDQSLTLAIEDEVDCVLELLRMLPALDRHSALVQSIDDHAPPERVDNLNRALFERYEFNIDRALEAAATLPSPQALNQLVEEAAIWRLERVRTALAHMFDRK